MNKTTIFCHGDCDGLTAGAIALAANPGARIWLTNPIGLADDLKREGRGLDRIVIVDIALNDHTLQELFHEMKKLLEAKTEIIYIDHHPLPQEITPKDIPVSTFVHEKGSSAELTYLHFEDKLTWKHKILAAIGAAGDYETETIFAQEVLRDYDYRSIVFQAALIVQSLGEIPVENDIQMKKSLIERMALGVLPVDLNNIVERAIRGCQVEGAVREYVHKNAQSLSHLGYIKDIPTGGGFNGKGALFAATAVDKPVGICGNSIGNRISTSIRRRDPRVDLNLIARIAGRTVGGSGGGHPAAAGATVNNDRWEDFLEILNFEIKKQLD